MTLYTDIPTHSEIDSLWEVRPEVAVLLYLQTAPDSSGQVERIADKNAVRAALAQLAPAAKSDLEGLADQLSILEEEDADDFWRHQARSLAVVATPSSLRTFRLPNRLASAAVGGSGFFVKPHLRALTFPQNGVRAGTRSSFGPPAGDAARRGSARGPGPDMPTDVATAVGESSIKGRSPMRRVQGSEGQELRMAQYARLSTLRCGAC